MKNPITKFALLLMFFILLPGSLPAQEEQQEQSSEYDRWLQDYNEDLEGFKNDLEAEWNAWVLADSLAFNDFKQQVEGKWGSVTETTQKDWVEYAEDKESLTAVDFEEGRAVVAILVEEESAESEDESLARLQVAVQNLVVDQGKTMDYSVSTQQPQPLSESPVLENQLADSTGKIVTADNSLQFAQEVVQNEKVQRTKVDSKDGVARVKLEVSIPLVPKHLRSRAQRFVEPVKHFADKYQLDSRVVLAMIHTESYFNPKAKSHIPAFGLMQLVPRYGAKDAYKFLHSEDRLLPPNYLYNPQQNVELGCAYMHIVMTRYLKSIENRQSRLYCAIAAYNTGAGNVSKAFTGKSRVGPAARKINKMTPDQVLAHLKKNLPYDETKDYIARILDRVKYYEEWKN